MREPLPVAGFADLNKQVFVCFLSSGLINVPIIKVLYIFYVFIYLQTALCLIFSFGEIYVTCNRTKIKQNVPKRWLTKKT